MILRVLFYVPIKLILYITNFLFVTSKALLYKRLQQGLAGVGGPISRYDLQHCQHFTYWVSKTVYLDESIQILRHIKAVNKVFRVESLLAFANQIDFCRKIQTEKKKKKDILRVVKGC